MPFEIFTEGIKLPYKGVTKNTVRKWVEKILVEIDLEKEIIAVILTDNLFIHHLNKTYRGKDSPTDVITFIYSGDGFPIPGEEENNFGDVYLSLEKCKEQSEEYGITFQEELKRLLVHGLLHLAGYDHELPGEEAARMTKKENELLDELKKQS